MRQLYQCNKCKYNTSSRALIREHVKTEHECKGGLKTQKEFAEDYRTGAGSKKRREGIKQYYTKKKLLD